MKTQIQYLRKFEYYIRLIKKTFLNQKYWTTENDVHVLHRIHSILGQSFLLYELQHQCGVAWRRSACGTAEVFWKPRLL